MPAKRFAALTLTSTTWTGVYTVPATQEAVMTVEAVNHDSSTAAHIWLAITDETNPANTRNEEVIYSYKRLEPQQSRTFKVIVVAGGLTLSARTDLPNSVTLCVYGFEETP